VFVLLFLLHGFWSFRLSFLFTCVVLTFWLTFLINLSWVEYCVIPHGKWDHTALRWGSINSHTEPLTHFNTNHLEDVAYWHSAVRKPVNKDRLQQPLGIMQRPASTCHSVTDRQTLVCLTVITRHSVPKVTIRTNRQLIQTNLVKMHTNMQLIQD